MLSATRRGVRGEVFTDYAQYEKCMGIAELNWDIYASNNPVANEDPLGRFTIDPSRKGRCHGFAGGGPQDPGKGPTMQNLEQVIQQQGDLACSNLQGSTQSTGPAFRRVVTRGRSSARAMVTSTVKTQAATVVSFWASLQAGPLICAPVTGPTLRRFPM